MRSIIWSQIFERDKNLVPISSCIHNPSHLPLEIMNLEYDEDDISADKPSSESEPGLPVGQS